MARNESILTRLVKGEVKQETLDVWMKALDAKIELLAQAEDRLKILKAKVKSAKDAGMSTREISKDLGVSHGTIWNWLKSMETSNAKETS